MRSFLHRVWRFFTNSINFKMGSIGAVIMAIVVWYINADVGFWPAVTASLKQAAYTLFFGGMLIRMLEKIVVLIEPAPLALFMSSGFTSLVTISLVYFIHNLKGTPYPFESTVPTILTAPFGFFFLAYRKRKSEDDKRKKEASMYS